MQYNKLKITEDPFAYLGILVDIIQEWDRYNVNPAGIFTRQLPIQGKDVLVKVKDSGIINFIFPNEKIANKIILSLSESLSNWKKIVEISFY